MEASTSRSGSLHVAIPSLFLLWVWSLLDPNLLTFSFSKHGLHPEPQHRWGAVSSMHLPRPTLDMMIPEFGLSQVLPT